MNIVRFYAWIALLSAVAVGALVFAGYWKWALIPLGVSFGTMAIAVAALIDQQKQINGLLIQQNRMLMAFFSHNGVKLEEDSGQ